MGVFSTRAIVSAAIFTFFSLAASGCGTPVDSDKKPVRNGTVTFSFEEEASAAASSVRSSEFSAQAFPPNLTAVRVSIRNQAGEAIADNQSLTLIAFGSSYVSENLSLAPGTYSVTEFIIVDDTNVARFVTPIQGSKKAGLVEHPLPVFFSVTEENSETVSLEVIEIDSTITPPDLGYPGLPPIGVIEPFDFTFQVVDADTGVQIPFSYVRRSDKGPTGGWSIGGSSWVYPPSVYTFGTVETGHVYGLQVRSQGYRDSPLLSLTAAALDLQRENVPVLTIELEGEDSTSALTYVGVQDGKHLYHARLESSEFIEDAIAAAGATSSSTYSYSIGFKLFSLEPSTHPSAPSGTLTYREVAPLNPDRKSAFVPYNSSVVQTADAYKSLDADLLLSDADHALVQNPAASLGMEVKVEVLMLTDDGDGVIDADDGFLGYEDTTLKLRDSQVVVN